MVYLQESENDLSIDNDPISFSEAINGDNSNKWLDAMKDELKSMAHNDVWDLVELPEGCKRVGCKWVFKTKRDSQGNIERYKARLVAKGFTQKDGDNAVVDAIKLILLNYSNFSIAKIVVKKIERVK